MNETKAITTETEIRPATNLYKKLITIRKQVEYLQKTETGNQGAKYVDPAVLLRLIRVKMDETGVLLYPSVLDPRIDQIDAPTKNNPNNRGFLSFQIVSYTWIDSETGESLAIPWFATGTHLTDPSMAFGGSMTYSERYFVLKFFQIPTSKDDPEFFNQKTLSNERITEKQHSEILDMMASKNIIENSFIEWLNDQKGTNISDMADLPARLHGFVISTIKSVRV